MVNLGKWLGQQTSKLRTRKNGTKDEIERESSWGKECDESGTSDAGNSAQAKPTLSTQGPSAFQGAQNVEINGGNIVTAGRDAWFVDNSVNHTVVNNVHPIVDGSEMLVDNIPTNNSREVHRDNHSKRTKDTCLWFIEGKDFQIWMNSDGRIMWGTGIPGSGKTVLASAVIEYLQEYVKSHPRVSLSFAYCRYTEDVAVVDILLSLIRQQAERHPAVEKAVGPIFLQHKREHTRPSLDELVGVLKTISKEFDMNIYVLDGLDEAKGDVQVKLVRILSSVGAHFFLTSRPLTELEETVPNAVFFDITAQDYDLELMFNERVEETPRFERLLWNNPGLREQVLGKIKEKARGMFLHASLQMDTLRHCLTTKDLRKKMEEFPLRIEDLYSSTMARINEHPDEVHVRMAKELLVWVLHANEPMKIDDLRCALAFSSDTQSFDEAGMVDEDVLISLCLGLVTLEIESQSVRLVHYTAKDVLQRILARDFPHPHELLAKTCIARLVSCNFQRVDQIKTTGNLRTALRSKDLLEYAYKHWVEHLQACDRQSEVWEIAGQFLLDCQSFPLVYNFRLELYQGLHLIVTHNLIEVLNHSGNRADSPWKPVNVNAQSTSEKSTPLYLASLLGRTEIVRFLLRSPDVQVNLGDRYGNVPLMMASRYGYEDMVLLLLDVPAIDVNHVNQWGSTTLLHASYHGHESVVKHLLAHPGIQVNMVDSFGHTALVDAAAQGRLAVVKLLLGVPGIEVDVANKAGKTALDLAAKEGHQDIVKLLRDYEP